MSTVWIDRTTRSPEDRLKHNLKQREAEVEMLRKDCAALQKLFKETREEIEERNKEAEYLRKEVKTLREDRQMDAEVFRSMWGSDAPWRLEAERQKVLASRAMNERANQTMLAHCKQGTSLA